MVFWAQMMFASGQAFILLPNIVVEVEMTAWIIFSFTVLMHTIFGESVLIFQVYNISLFSFATIHDCLYYWWQRSKCTNLLFRFVPFLICWSLWKITAHFILMVTFLLSLLALISDVSKAKWWNSHEPQLRGNFVPIFWKQPLIVENLILNGMALAKIIQTRLLWEGFFVLVMVYLFMLSFVILVIIVITVMPKLCQFQWVFLWSKYEFLSLHYSN